MEVSSHCHASGALFLRKSFQYLFGGKLGGSMVGLDTVSRRKILAPAANLSLVIEPIDLLIMTKIS
jgi:hypothetical protein